MKSKDQVRSHFKSERKKFALNAEAKQLAESGIRAHLSELFEQLEFKSVALYRAYGSEVNIDDLAEHNQNMTWAYPRVQGDDLAFYSQVDNFEQGQLGVMEPVVADSSKINVNDLDCVLIPGMAFDVAGGRMGTGKGFYDRALSTFGGTKIGVAFRVQCSEEDIPLEQHDIKMDYLVNEDFILQLNVGKENR